MKNPHPRRLTTQSGFTLVELLVVIAIIAVLAGILLGAANYALKAAQKAKTFNLASQIQSAGIAYYTEYSLYPVPGNPAAVASQDYLIADQSANAVTWQALLYGLCGNVNPYDGSVTAPTGAVANTRAIPFLSLKSSDVDNKNGPKNFVPTGGSIYLNMAIDNDYDNIIGDTGTPNGKVPNFNTSTLTAGMLYYTGALGPSGGIAVWANCNGNNNTVNPNSYVHTY